MKKQFNEIYNSYKGTIYSYLYYMVQDQQLAEDLSQETFFKIYTHLNKFKQECSVKTWCLIIARNTYLTYARKKKFTLVTEEISEKLHMESSYIGNEPEEWLLKKERGEFIRQILFQLSEEERNILILRDSEKLSYKEISQILNISEVIVKGRIYRARMHYKKLFLSKEEKLS